MPHRRKLRLRGKRTRKPQIKAIVRSVLNQQEEVKQKVYPAIAHNIQCGKVQMISPPHGISPGTRENQKVGGSIFIRDMVFKGYIQSTTTMYDTWARVMCVELNTPRPIWNTTTGNYDFVQSELKIGSIFHETVKGATPDELHYQAVLSGLINNSKVVRVHSDRVIHIPKNSTATFAAAKPFKLHLKLNKKVDYENPAELGSILKGNNYYFVVIPFVPGVAVGTTCADIFGQAMITYKDA